MCLSWQISGVQKSKPKHESTFKGSADVTSINIPLAKTSHMAKLNISEMGKCTPLTVGGTTGTAYLQGKWCGCLNLLQVVRNCDQ